MTSHHEPTGRDRPLTRRQLARLAQFHAGVFVFYAVDALFLLALGLQGVVPAPLWWMYALVGGCSAAVAIALFHRSPRRARDVDVNNLVMSSCGAVLMLVTAWFAPATGGLMLMTLMTVLATVALQVTLRSLVFVWLAFAGGTAAAIALSAEAFTLPMATTAQRLLTIAWFAWALASAAWAFAMEA